MGFLIAAAVWLLMVIVPVVGLILTIHWVFERASTRLRAMFGLVGYVLVVLPFTSLLLPRWPRTTGAADGEGR